MRSKLIVLTVAVLTAALCVPADATAGRHVPLGRQVLAPHDGWAAAGAGTT
ncbi:MAG: pectate lyase, partial [Actinophytocola sp.]|nr:pectate lyase [Actinophytocola sp.]